MVCIIGGEEEWSFRKKATYMFINVSSLMNYTCFSMSIKNNKYKIFGLLLANCLHLAQAAKAGSDNNGVLPEGSGFIATLCCCCCCLF